MGSEVSARVWLNVLFLQHSEEENHSLEYISCAPHASKESNRKREGVRECYAFIELDSSDHLHPNFWMRSHLTTFYCVLNINCVN